MLPSKALPSKIAIVLGIFLPAAQITRIPFSWALAEAIGAKGRPKFGGLPEAPLVQGKIHPAAKKAFDISPAFAVPGKKYGCPFMSLHFVASLFPAPTEPENEKYV